MKQATLDRIERIRAMLRYGATEKDIAKEEFRGRHSVYREWLDKFGKYLDMKTEEGVVEVAVDEVIEPITTTEEIGREFNQAEIEKLRELLSNADSLLSLVHRELEEKLEEKVEIGLTIPKEIMELEDIEYKSFRVSKALVKEFDMIAKNNKPFTKTVLINLALKEFIDKYK